MNYFTITNLIITVLFSAMGLLTAHFAVFAAIGLFKKRVFPKTEQKLKYGIVIPARNEGNVVGNLVDSIRKCDYPQEKLEIFVIAHNCTDNTAEMARLAGAHVYEYNNPDEKTKGYALHYLFNRISKDYGIKSFDGFVFFDADNILDKKYFEKINNAFVACDKRAVITPFRNTKNFGSNIMSAMYGLYFAYGCRFESRGRSVVGCSTRVQGTGHVVSSDILKDGWNYLTLTEDWEFTADQIIADTPIVYCDEAVFYDEQPTDFGIMWRQRLRWARGHFLVCISHFGNMVKGLFKSRKKGGCKRKLSVFDISVNIMPVCLMTASIFLLQQIFLLLSPLFGKSLADAYVEFFLGSFKAFILSYISLFLLSILLFALESKRFPKVSLPIQIGSALLFPIFILISVPMEIVSIFCKNLGWKTIPHTDTTDFEKLNEHHDVAKEDSALKNPKAVAESKKAS